MRLFGSDRIDKIAEMCKRVGLDEKTAIDDKILSGVIESAQKKLEDNNFQRRKNVLTYDDVMNQQRNVIYQQRAEVLMNDNIQEKIIAMITQSVEDTFDFCFGLDNPEDWNFDEFRNHYVNALVDSKNFEYTDEELHSIDKAAWKAELVETALAIYRGKDELFAKAGMSQDAMREVEKVILLQNVDKKWMDHLETMDELKEYVGLNSYAQRDPVAMFRIQGADIFDQMVDDIKEDTVRLILTVAPQPKAIERVQVAKPLDTGNGSGPVVRRPVVKVVKVGRNDPCPCGSGKKFKKCCGLNQLADKD
jgi:preprotein translocase subunit SecA